MLKRNLRHSDQIYHYSLANTTIYLNLKARAKFCVKRTCAPTPTKCHLSRRVAGVQASCTPRPLLRITDFAIRSALKHTLCQTQSHILIIDKAKRALSQVHQSLLPFIAISCCQNCWQKYLYLWCMRQKPEGHHAIAWPPLGYFKIRSIPKRSNPRHSCINQPSLAMASRGSGSRPRCGHTFHRKGQTY
jgi:hypothetical protein